MPTLAKPWTQQDEERRQKILAMAAARGVSQKELAQAAGVNAVKLHRWTKGAAHLTDAQIAKIVALLQSMPTRVDPALAQPPPPGSEASPRATTSSHESAHAPAGTGAVPDGVKRALEVLDSLAGPVPVDDEDALRTMARRHTQAALGTFVRLMVGAKSDAVKMRAAEVIVERAWGKALQALVDMTPKPPAEDRELIALFKKIAGADGEPEPQTATPEGGIQ
jgi:transcriptional regulator with XRE-family HTH domain